MNTNFFVDYEFVTLMKKHIIEIADLLLAKFQEFSILVNISDVEFDPPLPAHIKDTFKPFERHVYRIDLTK